MALMALFTQLASAQLTINIRYSGENGNARKYVEEMESSGIAARIRAIEGCIRYDYFFPADDPEGVLLIDEWSGQEALDRYHSSPVMQEAAALREKYRLGNRQISMFHPLSSPAAPDSRVAQPAGGVIDVHSHMIPDSYMEALKAHGMEMDEKYPIPSWNAEAHLRFMDDAGIRTSVLTMPAPQPFFGNGEEAAAICRDFNKQAAALKARYPGRFLFCAALPLPDVDAAVAEAKYALEVLGADGVKLATNSYGQYLGDEALEPLMAYLNSRKAVIITHPHKPSAVNEKLVSAVPLASYEYLAETTRAILNMVAHDVLVRYPDLKVVVPHCGSFLPNALPRFKGLLPVMVAQGYMKPVDVDANLSRLYFDLAGAATDDAIESLLTITDPTHILYGSDYPYVAAPALVAAKKGLEDRLGSHALTPQSVLAGNAARLFGAEETTMNPKKQFMKTIDFSVWPKGEPNTAYSQYFSGNSYLASLEGGIVNVTFEPGCHNNWHIHHKQVQVLICVAGRGWYQEWGKEAVPMTPGTVIAVPAEVKHWHGAAKDSWFQHLTYHKDVQDGASNQWLEPVDDAHYDAL